MFRRSPAPTRLPASRHLRRPRPRWRRPARGPAPSLAAPMLVHGGIWGAAGLAGGLAFGLGLRGGRSSIARAAAGGLAGALLAAFLFEATAAMVFPKAATTRPLSLTPESRLMAKLMVSLLSAAGIAALLAGRPASPGSGPGPTPPEREAGPPLA